MFCKLLKSPTPILKNKIIKSFKNTFQHGNKILLTVNNQKKKYNTQKKTVTLIEGDGIGKEITTAVRRLFAAADVPIEWDVQSFKNQQGEMDVKTIFESIRKNKIALSGPFSTPIGDGHESISAGYFGKEFDIFAHVTPCKTPLVPDYVPLKVRDFELTIVRENTEGEYSGLEHEVVPGVVESLKVITRWKCERVARLAFDIASRNWGHKVIAIHKANIMKKGDGLFLQVCKEISKEYPDVPFEDLIIDNCSMQLVNYPHKFQRTVIVTTNLYGAFLQNIAGGLVGGPGVLGGYFSSSGKERIFAQGVRHAALDIAGKGLANPLGIMRSSYYMLSHLGMHSHSLQIRQAIFEALNEGKAFTRDLGGNSTTEQFTDSVISKLTAPSKKVFRNQFFSV